MEALDRLSWKLRQLKQRYLKRMRTIHNRWTLKTMMKLMPLLIKLVELAFIIAKHIGK